MHATTDFRSVTPCRAPARILSARRFLAVFAAIALCFLGATAYTQHLQGDIDRAALDIADNAAPSIEHLAQARTYVRHVQLLVHRAADAGMGDQGTLADIAAVRGRFHAEIDAYQVLPTFPGERALWQHLSDEVRAFEGALDRIMLSLAAGDAEGAAALADGPLARAARGVAEATTRALELNAAEARELARAIEVSHERAALVEKTLDGVIAVLAIAAGWLLFRAVRHYESLLEESYRLSQRRADELEGFAGRVAHDILSPLGAAALAFSLIDRAAGDEEKVKANAARGRRNLDHVQRLVDGLLDLARAGARPAPGARAEVGPIVEDVAGEVRLAAVEAGIDVSLAPFPSCAVACNEGALTSLVSNLLRNAVKYMGASSERCIRVSVLDRGLSVRVEVADTGPGIPLPLQTAIFEPYVRAHVGPQPGLGLGLATVKRLAESHDGSVGVRSTPGQGSVFWFELPKPARDAEERCAAEAPARAALA